MRIYTKDGTYKEVDDTDVEVINIKSEDIHALVQVSTGVDIIMKDGSIKHIANAKTDGFQIEIEV